MPERFLWLADGLRKTPASGNRDHPVKSMMSIQLKRAPM
jgi:hypothetical protein